jgi:hypothetical protein
MTDPVSSSLSNWQFEIRYPAPEPRSSLQSTIENRQSTIGCEAFDFDSDGDIDLRDFAQFLLIAAP